MNGQPGAVRILMMGPVDLAGVGGNVTTIRRLRDGLQARGHEVEYAAVGEGSAASRWDVVHAFHAGRSGPSALQVSREAGCPLVVSLTGTDSASLPPAVAEALQAAARVVAFGAFQVDALRGLGADLPDARVRIIPQSVALPPGGQDMRPALGLAEGEFAFVLVAGIRPVKRPHLPLEPLRRLRADHPRIAYRIVGEVLDPNYVRALDARLAQAGPWARRIETVDRGRMAGVYRAADVALNCSESEAMPNALLEALACGRPVLAADIPGNRVILEHERNALLFSDGASFEEGAHRLLQDAALRARLAEAAQRSAAHQPPPAAELDAYERLYAEIHPEG